VVVTYRPTKKFSFFVTKLPSPSSPFPLPLFPSLPSLFSPLSFPLDVGPLKCS